MRDLPINSISWLHFDETRAVEPLERTAEWTMEEVGEPAETYPSGL
jgi:hypothetical protein